MKIKALEKSAMLCRRLPTIFGQTFRSYVKSLRFAVLDIFNPTCLMRFETEVLGDSCFYGCRINSFYVCMCVCMHQHGGLYSRPEVPK